MIVAGQISSVGGGAGVLGTATPAANGTDAATFKRKAEELEGFFLSQMLQPMFAEIGSEEPFGGGHAEQMWRSLQIDEFGKAMARVGGVGLADAVMREMLALQEQGDHPA